MKNDTLNKLDFELGEKYQAALRRRAYGMMLPILKKENVDIILSFYLLNSGWIAQLLANELNIPCVAGVRGNDIGRNIFHTSRFAVVKWVVDEANAIVCVNEHLKHRATVAFKEIRNKTLTIPNGFDCSKADLCQKQNRSVLVKWGWSKDDLILAFIGTLREKKGVAVLMKSLQMVNSLNVHVRLFVVGPSIGGAEKVAIGNIWNDLVKNNIIRFTGQVPREDVLFNASVADAICIPSLDDGMANGLLEGMAIGLCPITTTVLGDVVRDGDNGIVVEPGNACALVEAIELLYKDRILLRKYGERSRKIIRDFFRPEQEAQKYIHLFKKILEEKNEYTTV